MTKEKIIEILEIAKDRNGDVPFEIAVKAISKMEIEALQKQDPKESKLVRCRDCKYAEVADAEDTQDGYTCQFHRGSIWFSGSYCSWAERRTDG